MASLTVFNITVLAVGAAFGSAVCVALVMLSKRSSNGLVSETQTKRVPATQRGLMATPASPVKAAEVTGDFVFLEQERSPNRSSREESVVGLGMCLQYLSGSVMIEAVVPGYAAAVGKLQVSYMASPACSCARALKIYVHLYLCLHICLYVHMYVYACKQCCRTHACTNMCNAHPCMHTFAAHFRCTLSHAHTCTHTRARARALSLRREIL